MTSWTCLYSILTCQILITNSLKCFNCDYYENRGGSFGSDCDPKLVLGEGSGFAGCVRIHGLTENKGEIWMIYGGYLNKQVEGRPPSCYHEDNADLKFDNFLSSIKLASISKCYACDDYDGCNSSPQFTPFWPLILFFILLHYLQ